VVAVIGRNVAILVVCVPLACATGRGAREPIEVPHGEIPPTPRDADVIVHLSRFRFGGDGTVRESAARLEGHVERPWTVERLAAFSAATLDCEQRAAAVYLLAASRDPMGLQVVGNALEDREARVRVAAAEGIVFYWIGELYGGSNAEGMLSDAWDWWEERKATLTRPRR